MIILLETLEGQQSTPFRVHDNLGPMFRATLPPLPSILWQQNMEPGDVPNLIVATFFRTEECVPAEFRGTLFNVTIYRQGVTA